MRTLLLFFFLLACVHTDVVVDVEGDIAMFMFTAFPMLSMDSKEAVCVRRFIAFPDFKGRSGDITWQDSNKNSSSKRERRDDRVERKEGISLTIYKAQEGKAIR